MRIVPISAADANKIVEIWHRHNRPLEAGVKFCVGLESEGKYIGAAIVGQPISITYEDGFTLEVRRLVTNGTKNACSILYAACIRAAKAMGFRRLFTYTLTSESMASLKASGWKLDGESSGIAMFTVSDDDPRAHDAWGKHHEKTSVKRRWVYQLSNEPITPVVLTKYDDLEFLYPIADYTPVAETPILDEAF